MCEPCPPASRTRSPSKMTLENSILPSTEPRLRDDGTYPGGQAFSGRPAIARRAGATKTWKETRALTGLPGRVKTETLLAEDAEALGHAGPHRHLV